MPVLDLREGLSLFLNIRFSCLYIASIIDLGEFTEGFFMPAGFLMSSPKDLPLLFSMRESTEIGDALMMPWSWIPSSIKRLLEPIKIGFHMQPTTALDTSHLDENIKESWWELFTDLIHQAPSSWFTSAIGFRWEMQVNIGESSCMIYV